MKDKPRILILTDFYLPGYKSGGGLRTLVNMIERLSDEFDFRVVTRNHDGWGDFSAYDSVKTNEWNAIGPAQVFYFGAKGLSLSVLRKIWREVEPDAVYLNSFLSTLTIKAMLLWRSLQVPKKTIVIAPEGEFSDGALQIKKHKKKIFLTLTRRMNWTRNIVWKAAAEEEKNDIRRILGEECEIYIAPNLQPKTLFPEYTHEIKPLKEAGKMRIVFLSRVNRKKNLSFALSALAAQKGEIEFDIYGALDDEAYWQECRDLIKQMPENVKVSFKGSIAYERVAETLAQYHFFILPTLGENFGHVVVEALAAGCPVLLSDKTPWRNLNAQGAGWDLSLDDNEKWHEVVQKCIQMSGDDYRKLAQSARDFSVSWLAAPEIENANRAVLLRAVDGK